MRASRVFVWGLFLWLTQAVQGADLDHAPWGALLRQHVQDSSGVDYAAWKKSGFGGLLAYLDELARPWPAGMEPRQVKAALINAYNAFTVRWILDNYPVDNIWRTTDPFQAARHRMDGKPVSLDDIEERLRGMNDPRIHAALVCAARSCPPLRREAYVAGQIDAQLDDNLRRWLADPRLNEFFPDRGAVRLSPIFQWYAHDFADQGGMRYLAGFAPAEGKAILESANAMIDYQSYSWDLNSSEVRGAEAGRWYSGARRLYAVNPAIFGGICLGATLLVGFGIRAAARRLRRVG